MNLDQANKNVHWQVQVLPSESFLGYSLFPFNFRDSQGCRHLRAKGTKDLRKKGEKSFRYCSWLSKSLWYDIFICLHSRLEVGKKFQKTSWAKKDADPSNPQHYWLVTRLVPTTRVRHILSLADLFSILTEDTVKPGVFWSGMVNSGTMEKRDLSGVPV